MSAVDEIQAAIDKLTELKAESTPGPWGGSVNILGVTRLMDADRYIVAEVYDARGADEEASVNVDLIVTLHATIDAQIKLLNQGIRFAEISPNIVTDAALEFARSINGATHAPR